MNASQSGPALESRLATRGLTVEQMGPIEALDIMVEFYESVRFADVDLEADGDMLLFQWGSSERPSGPTFELDFTRQFITSSAAEDEDFWQLSLTLQFGLSAAGRQIGSGDRWCYHPTHLAEFRHFVLNSPAMQYGLSESARGGELDFFAAG